MKVYKFGGASVKDAAGIKNLFEIVSKEESELVIVVSAIGKTTNALEKILDAWFADNQVYHKLIEDLLHFHFKILDGLNFEPESDAIGLVYTTIEILKEYLTEAKKDQYDFEYDQVISYGEVLSSIIVFEYLKPRIKGVELVDVRDAIRTDNKYRDANILWEESRVRTNTVFNFLNTRIYLTQGFIGGSADGNSTTLGREGIIQQLFLQICSTPIP
jgi:aspartate kinase